MFEPTNELIREYQRFNDQVFSFSQIGERLSLYISIDTVFRENSQIIESFIDTKLAKIV